MTSEPRKIPLTAIVITHNEQENIARCLASLSFCSEILVVDSVSTDDTQAIARRYTPLVIEQPWQGYAAQKNFACARASYDWVLSIDADECVSEDLRHEIETRWPQIESGSVAAFSMPRKTIHLGRWIRYGGWYPNRLIRLFRRSRGKWTGEELHESWHSTGEDGALESALVHYSFHDLADQVDRNNRYSSLGAQRLDRLGKKFSFFRLCFKTKSKFIETYFLKLGFLDGYPGLIISVSAAYSVFLKWAKLWELQNGEKKVG